jgi:hypothetical protein
MGGKPDIDRQHPQFPEHLQDAVLGRDRQCKDHKIDSRPARELHEIVHRAELLTNIRERALLTAVVEYAENAHVAVSLVCKRTDQRVATLISADDHGAPIESTLLRPAPYQQEYGATETDQQRQSSDVKAPEPKAGIMISDLGKEGSADDEQKYHRPGRGKPKILLLITAECLHLIDIGALEREHRKHRDSENRPDIAPFETFDWNDIGHLDSKADRHDQREFGHPHKACDHDG